MVFCDGAPAVRTPASSQAKNLIRCDIGAFLLLLPDEYGVGICERRNNIPRASSAEPCAEKRDHALIGIAEGSQNATPLEVSQLLLYLLFGEIKFPGAFHDAVLPGNPFVSFGLCPGQQ